MIDVIIAYSDFSKQNSLSKYVCNLVKELSIFSELKIKIVHPKLLSKILSKNRGDKCYVVHLPYLVRGMFPRMRAILRVAVKKREIKLVVTLHGFDSAALRNLAKDNNAPCDLSYCGFHQLFLDTINKSLWRTLGNFIVDYIIVPSHSEKKNVCTHLSINPDKIKVIYHGVDHTLFKPLPYNECEKHLNEKYDIKLPYILHVSAYQPKKNIERIIAAYAYAKRRYRIRGSLVIIGKHPRKRLLRFARELGLSRTEIRIIGLVSEEELPIFYNAAEAFIFPSLHESFGLPILEAMACGCPVITSNLFACPEIARNAALFVNPFDIKDIAHAIYAIMHDKDIKEELSRRGLIRAREFTWRRCAREHYKIYKLAIYS